MRDLLYYLPVVPGGLAMLGSLVYLWTARRRSPRAAGLGAAGLVGGLAVHFGGSLVVMPRVYRHIGETGQLLGLPTPAAYTAAVTGYNVLLSGCLLMVVAAVMADRRRPTADED